MEASEINRLNINKPKIDLQEKIENDNNEKEEKISRNSRVLTQENENDKEQKQEQPPINPQSSPKIGEEQPKIQSNDPEKIVIYDKQKNSHHKHKKSHKNKNNNNKKKNENDPSTNIKYGYEAQNITCPFCQKNIYTNVEEKFNCITVGACFLIIIFFPIIILFELLLCICHICDQTHYSKGTGDNCDCLCCEWCRIHCKCFFDADHYCPSCKQKIGTRNSLIVLCPCCSRC